MLVKLNLMYTKTNIKPFSIYIFNINTNGSLIQCLTFTSSNCCTILTKHKRQPHKSKYKWQGHKNTGLTQNMKDIKMT